MILPSLPEEIRFVGGGGGVCISEGLNGERIGNIIIRGGLWRIKCISVRYATRKEKEK